MLKITPILFVTLIVLLAASCAPVIPATPAPILTDEPSIPVTGMAVVQSVEVQVLGPSQVNAILRGQLPDSGCTTISSIGQVREGNTIKLSVNTVSTVDPAVSCLQVLTPFEQVVPLDVSNLTPGTYKVNVNGLEQSFELPAQSQSVEQFRQTLVDALNARDYGKLKGLMDASFTIAYWQSEGTSNTPDQVIEQLQRNLLNSSSSIVADPNKDFVALLRSDPVSSGAVEASFACANVGVAFCVTIAGPNKVEASPLFTSGWGARGKDESILFIAKRPNGDLYWHGMLFATDGFARPDPVVVTPVDTKAYATQVQYVLAQQDVRMRSGPGTEFSVISFVAAGQTAKVTGVSANGAWWRVICPDNSVGNCWVSAASNLTKPVKDPLPDTTVYPTDVKYVMAQRDVNIYSGPSAQASSIGYVAAGQTALVTGVNADRRWWRVICPDSTAGSCWVSADPRFTQPVDFNSSADVQSVEVQVLQSNPVQVNAIARGMLPDAGCTTLSGASQSRSGNTILVTLMTRRDPLALCAQMLTPFEYSIPLDVSALLPGRYMVNVNGVAVSFELPAPVTYP